MYITNYFHIFLIFYFKTIRKVYLELLKASLIQNLHSTLFFYKETYMMLIRLPSSACLYDYKIEQFQDTSSQNTYDENILFGFPYSFYVLRIGI